MGEVFELRAVLVGLFNTVETLISGSSASFASLRNKNMPSLQTTIDGGLACAMAIGATPRGFVQVAVNGILYVASPTGPCFFSGNGTTKRVQGTIVAGDLLYWVGSIAQFQLSTQDIVDFYFME